MTKHCPSTEFTTFEVATGELSYTQRYLKTEQKKQASEGEKESSDSSKPGFTWSTSSSTVSRNFAEEEGVSTYEGAIDKKSFPSSHVLDTDYSTYLLKYSCESRTVTSDDDQEQNQSAVAKTEHRLSA